MNDLHIYTMVTPEGKEFILGAYKTDRSAKSAARRHFAADWLSLAGEPLRQRPLRKGEKVTFAQPWMGR